MVLSVKASVLLSLALLARAFVNKSSASTRYFLISGAIIIATCLPLLSAITPDWRPPMPTMIQANFNIVPILEPHFEIPDGTQKIMSADNIGHIGEVDTLLPSIRSVGLAWYLWLLGMLVASGRVFVGLATCERSRRKAERVTSKHILTLVNRAAYRIGLSNRPAIMISSTAKMPYICGLVKPVLFLPCNVRQWPEDRLMSVLLHELAHIKRKDHITWPLTNLAASWLWFSPIVWIALTLVKRDREKACDDYVVNSGCGKSGYAQHLLELCVSVRTTMRLAPMSLLFAKKNTVKERITYMFDQGIDHQPISRWKRTALVVLLLIIAVPLMSIKGFSTTSPPQDVTPQEKEAAITMLRGFYSELNNESDYQSTRNKYLASDYCDHPNVTLENLDEAVRKPPFNEAGVGMAKTVHSRILSIQREDEELVITQQLDVTADWIKGEIVDQGECRIWIRRPHATSTHETLVAENHLVKGVIQKIRLRLEDGAWKIAGFQDGVAVMHMDTDNPYGPIFLVWTEQEDSQAIPFSACVLNTTSQDADPDSRNTRFELEN